MCAIQLLHTFQTLHDPAGVETDWPPCAAYPTSLLLYYFLDRNDGEISQPELIAPLLKFKIR